MPLLIVQLVVDEVVLLCVLPFGHTCRIRELGEKVLVHCALLLLLLLLIIQLGVPCDLVFEM